MDPIFTLPATCELCGNWLPGHATSCARYGVHPSQWKHGLHEEPIELTAEIPYKILFYSDIEESNEQTIELSH